MKIGSRKYLYSGTIHGSYAVMRWKTPKLVQERYEKSEKEHGRLKGRYAGKHHNHDHTMRKSLASKLRKKSQREIIKILEEL